MSLRKKRVLIVGAGVAGGIVAEVLKQKADSDLEPIAFVDDDPAKQNTVIHDLLVLGNRQNIINIVEKLNIEHIIIAMPSAPGEEISQIVDICQKTKIQIKILPAIYDLITGKIKVSDLRDVEIEDLLGRPAALLNIKEVAGYLRNQVILITGAGGSIGSEICRQVALLGPKLIIILGHGENSIYEIEQELKIKFSNIPITSIIADIRDYHCINEIFAKYRPAVVFHAAAHKHVSFMEKNKAEAIKNNVLGTKILTEAASLNNTKIFILISTDKAVNPTSIMGTTKRVAEMILQRMNETSSTKFATVRFGNVLGSRGSVIPLFKKQIALGGPVTVTHPDMKRYFMTISEAVQLVIQAGALAQGGEIFVLDMGKPIYIVELAKKLISLSGFEPDKDIAIKYTGIRPGEKYVEVLYSDQEQVLPTKHERIFKVTPQLVNYSELNDIIEILEKNEFTYSEQEICKFLTSYAGLKQDL